VLAERLPQLVWTVLSLRCYLVNKIFSSTSCLTFSTGGLPCAFSAGLPCTFTARLALRHHRWPVRHLHRPARPAASPAACPAPSPPGSPCAFTAGSCGTFTAELRSIFAGDSCCAFFAGLARIFTAGLPSTFTGDLPCILSGEPRLQALRHYVLPVPPRFRLEQPGIQVAGTSLERFIS